MITETILACHGKVCNVKKTYWITLPHSALISLLRILSLRFRSYATEIQEANERRVRKTVKWPNYSIQIKHVKKEEYEQKDLFQRGKQKYFASLGLQF